MKVSSLLHRDHPQWSLNATESAGLFSSESAVVLRMQGEGIDLNDTSSDESEEGDHNDDGFLDGFVVSDEQAEGGQEGAEAQEKRKKKKARMVGSSGTIRN